MHQRSTGGKARRRAHTTTPPRGTLALCASMTADAAFEIRPATPDDAPLLFHLVTELARYERLEHEVSGSADLLRAQLATSPAPCEALLAMDGDTPLGFALHYPTFSTFLTRPGIHLEDLFVVPEARGRGIGRQLLLALARLADSRGCGRLEWDVLDWNQPAIAFYASLGAAAVEGWTRYRMTGEPLGAAARRA